MMWHFALALRDLAGNTLERRTSLNPKKKMKANHRRSRKKQISPRPFLNFGKGTVFVLGAGFTRAFLKDAPLLVDHCYGDELRKKFANFPDALTILDAELNDPRHPQKIDIERLMTRLAGGMPYDFVAEHNQPIAANHELEYLLVEVKKAFVRRLNEAHHIEVLFPGELWLFAQHVSENRNHCITFSPMIPPSGYRDIDWADEERLYAKPAGQS
jgi:hypothetical protein